MIGIRRNYLTESQDVKNLKPQYPFTDGKYTHIEFATETEAYEYAKLQGLSKSVLRGYPSHYGYVLVIDSKLANKLDLDNLTESVNLSKLSNRSVSFLKLSNGDNSYESTENEYPLVGAEYYACSNEDGVPFLKVFLSGLLDGSRSMFKIEYRSQDDYENNFRKDIDSIDRELKSLTVSSAEFKKFIINNLSAKLKPINRISD